MSESERYRPRQVGFALDAGEECLVDHEVRLPRAAGDQTRALLAIPARISRCVTLEGRDRTMLGGMG
jgi:hypothetical protein